jgi:hypothetical protein
MIRQVRGCTSERQYTARRFCRTWDLQPWDPSPDKQREWSAHPISQRRAGRRHATSTGPKRALHSSQTRSCHIMSHLILPIRREREVLTAERRPAARTVPSVTATTDGGPQAVEGIVEGDGGQWPRSAVTRVHAQVSRIRWAQSISPRRPSPSSAMLPRCFRSRRSFSPARRVCR